MKQIIHLKFADGEMEAQGGCHEPDHMSKKQNRPGLLSSSGWLQSLTGNH